mgnify:FL=1|jgi:Uncharacterized conserved protein (some members contain a von Willebrand factor type A (vWA) domain)
MITTDPDALFDAELLRRFESLSLLARQLVRGRMRAERRSVQRGASVEFAEYRPFVEGDDWRYVDWHAFARWRQLVLKLFVEEEDLHVHLLLDCSASMDWGNPVKFDQARRILAGLAYIALANLDRAALVPLGAGDMRAWPPTRGRDRFFQMLRYLAACPVGSGPLSLETAVRSWIARQPRRGLVVWVGDLLGADSEDALRALDRLRHARHEIAVIQLLDPSEQRAAEPGEYEFEDCESGATRRVVVDAAAARAFRQRYEAYLESIDRYGKMHRIPILRATTEDAVGDVLTKTLRWR